jgi:hypothetical protein
VIFAIFVSMALRRLIGLRFRTGQSTAHAATVEAMYPLAYAAWLVSGLVLAAGVPWAAWGVVWTPRSGPEPIGLSIAVLLWLAGAWMTLRGAIGGVDRLAFGRVRLEFDTWPMCVGALVRGHVVVARGADRLVGVDVRLSLTQHPAIAPKDGSGGRRQVIWSTIAIAVPDDPDVPAAFAFSFRIPVDQHGTWVDAGNDSGNFREFYTWRLHLSASDGSRANLARSFDVPVM